MVNIMIQPRFKIGDKVQFNSQAVEGQRLEGFPETFTIAEIHATNSDPDKSPGWLYTMEETYQGSAIRYTEKYLMLEGTD